MNHKTITAALAATLATITAAGPVHAEYVDSHPDCPPGTDHIWRQDVNDGAHTIIPGSTGGWTLTAIVIELVGGGTLVFEPTAGPVWVGRPGATSFLLCKGTRITDTTTTTTTEAPPSTTTTTPPTTLPSDTTSTSTAPTTTTTSSSTTTAPPTSDVTTTTVPATTTSSSPPASSVPTPTLPRTGHDDPVGTVWVAFGLAVLGGALIWLSRRGGAS